MALPVLTIPLGPIKRQIFQKAGTALGILEGLLEESAEINDNFEWRRFILEWTRPTPTGTTEDRCQVGFDVVNLTDASIDSTWTTADHVAVKDKLVTFWSEFNPLVSSTFVLANIRAYRRRFAPIMTDDKRFADSGPPVYSFTSGVAGTSAAQALPYQIAMSLTLKTALPRHWGRVYMPGLTEDAVTTLGRWDTADVATAVTPLQNFLNGMWDAQFPVMIATTQINKVLVKVLLNVTSGQIDDIPDVIRRRRPRTPALRAAVPMT